MAKDGAADSNDILRVLERIATAMEREHELVRVRDKDLVDQLNAWCARESQVMADYRDRLEARFTEIVGSRPMPLMTTKD